MSVAGRPSVWLLVAALAVLLSADGQEDCGIFYLVQPPSQLTCNPYLDTSRFSLRLECMVAVHRSTGVDASEFEIRWLAQLGGGLSSGEPEELQLNDTSTFGVRIDRMSETTADFVVYHSQARITGMEISLFDQFWCQIDVLRAIRNTTNITGLGRSEQTIIAEHNYYLSPLLPFCPQQAFFHQTSLKCANTSLGDPENATLSEPPVVASSSPQSTQAPLNPTSCPPPFHRRENGESGRLVSVLLPSLMLPVIVAVLLVIAALIMTCGHGRNLRRKQRRRRKMNEAASMENLASPVVITPPAAATVPPEEPETSPIETTTRVKSPPPRPPPPALKPALKNTNRSNSPLATVPTHSSSSSAAAQPSNRFSQDIYEDIADSALDSYSMSNNDIYSMKNELTSTPREDVVHHHHHHHEMDRLPHLNGPFLFSKVGKRDESGIGHYKNAALISISDRAAPMLVPKKKTAASLPSLLDPKHYHDTASPKRRPNEAPDSLRATSSSSSQGQKGDHYDSLAQKKPDPTYYNQATATESSGSLARLIEDEEPDYDEVEEEEQTTSGRARGGSGGRPLVYPLAVGKLACVARHQNCVSVMSESYEDMSGMEDFIESYKSATSSVTGL